jgi:shikimate dehydrogenase
VPLAGKTETRPVTTLSKQYDLIVQSTPLGLHPQDPLPFDADHLQGAPAVMDLVYRPEGTRLVHALRAAGARAVDGKEMLLQQAAESFERWWQTPAPLAVMRSALTPPNLPAV